MRLDWKILQLWNKAGQENYMARNSTGNPNGNPNLKGENGYKRYSNSNNSSGGRSSRGHGSGGRNGNRDHGHNLNGFLQCDPTWYPNLGASNHLTNDLNNLTLKGNYNGTDQVLDRATGKVLFQGRLENGLYILLSSGRSH
ncbi:hypothetical protein BC332_18310 [Capsicum chinense]|nr:hypothetical protein BC332_18310 [Capsicum chinense]